MSGAQRGLEKQLYAENMKKRKREWRRDLGEIVERENRIYVTETKNKNKNNEFGIYRMEQ